MAGSEAVSLRAESEAILRDCRVALLLATTLRVGLLRAEALAMTQRHHFVIQGEIVRERKLNLVKLELLKLIQSGEVGLPKTTNINFWEVRLLKSDLLNIEF